jgi:hypothetical protein
MRTLSFKKKISKTTEAIQLSIVQVKKKVDFHIFYQKVRQLKPKE